MRKFDPVYSCMWIYLIVAIILYGAISQDCRNEWQLGPDDKWRGVCGAYAFGGSLFWPLWVSYYIWSH